MTLALVVEDIRLCGRRRVPRTLESDRVTDRPEGAIDVMFWYGHEPNGWGWLGMGLGMLVFWALVIMTVAWAVRQFGRSGPSVTDPGTVPRTPEAILAERFAQGEIDEVEYHDRLAILQQAQRSPAAR